jgi:hypothetical protein
MFFFVIGNTVEMIWAMTEPEDSVLEILDAIDQWMLYVFTAEVAFRVLGTSMNEYFSDNWNKFDFILVVISFATDLLLGSIDFAKNARSARLVKISRLQKTLRITKSLRGFKIFKFCMGILSSFYRIKQLLEIIIISLPALWRTLSLILIFFYLWACVGVEIFRESRLVRIDIPQYGISDFFSYGNAILEMAHIMIANGWAELMMNYCERFHMQHSGMAFFMSFHAFVNIVLMSLLSGLVWEVFSFVDKTSNSAEQGNNQNKLELEDLSKNLRKNHFHTLRFVSLIHLNEEHADQEEAEHDDKCSVNMTGLQKEIKKEMGDEQKYQLNTLLPRMSRNSIPFLTSHELNQLKMHRKRASLANSITGTMSPLNMIKDKHSQDSIFTPYGSLDQEIQKIDNSLKVPQIKEQIFFINTMAGLNLDYGIGVEKVSAESSLRLVTIIKNESPPSKAESFSQNDLFVNSDRQIVTFSEDLSVKDITPILKQQDVYPNDLNKEPEVIPTKVEIKGGAKRVDKKKLTTNLKGKHALDVKSILPQKPNSEYEDSNSKEGFKLNKLQTLDVGKHSKDVSENSSELQNRLVLNKSRASNESKTEQPNKITPTKVEILH